MDIYEDMLHSDGIATYNHIDRVPKLIEKSEYGKNMDYKIED